MRTPSNVAGHPIHPILVTIPIGTLVLAFVFDLVTYALGGTTWLVGAFGATVVGFVGVLLSAVPGLVDYRALPAAHPAKPTARKHMLLGVGILLLSALSAGAHWGGVQGTVPLAGVTVLAFIIVLALLGQGWLGGTLVYEQHIAVSESAEEQLAVERRRSDVPGGRKSV